MEVNFLPAVFFFESTNLFPILGKPGFIKSSNQLGVEHQIVLSVYKYILSKLRPYGTNPI